ncbi:MAG: S53 family peptidase [Burkholderiales bacterium]
MIKTITQSELRHCDRWFSVLAVAALLVACGGGEISPNASQQAAAQIASATTTLQLDAAALSHSDAAVEAQPMFHAAPALLPEPDDTVDNEISARQGPNQQMVSAEFQGLSTRRLTVQSLRATRQLRMQGGSPISDAAATAFASNGLISTYSPAQIRSAYALPALPVAGNTPTATQAAQMGAGQTIYIIDAMHDPNVVTELSAFNQKFGLPSCTSATIATAASLPLPAASASACEFSVVYSTPSGTLSGTTPAYDAGWAGEIAMDVQWAHATAPLARIVLIEAADASTNSLLGAVKLANAMGPGIVSMSFGANEGSWTASVDTAFTKANMSYVAATGDAGAAVYWPAVSSNVLAVGGTTLTYSGTGVRSEVSWSGTGGGTSLYTPTPSYQTSAVPGMGAVAHRTVADVAFNADPYTGQYVAIVSPGSSAVNWISGGGTSLAAPQWAGLMAVSNALRVLAAKPALGAPHSVLYGQIGAVPGNYASAFADITKGSDGRCATCTAKVGYDPLSGLGTPNANSLLGNLTGATVVATAPVVTSANISGQVGTALSFTVSVTAPNAVSYALSGAPSGMTIGSTGVVTWATPVAGTYAVTVTAQDVSTGLSGQGLYTITIAAPTAPVVGTATITGAPGVALSFTPAVVAPNPVTYALIGAPAGMGISSTGVISWASPVSGTYAVTVIAKDTKTGLSGQGVCTVVIATPSLVITAPAMTGLVGKPLIGTITVSDSNAGARVLASLSGVPVGMSFVFSGMTITANWPSPVLGSYSLKVSVADSTGLTAQVSVPITITAK